MSVLKILYSRSAFPVQFRLLTKSTASTSTTTLKFSQRKEMSEKCIFCKICRGEMPETKKFYKDEEFTVFSDHSPAAPHHYLVCTNQHIPNPKALTKNDIGLVEKMMNVGMQVLQDNDGNTGDVRMGFHWPPFTTISHLHLHVISPQSQMGLISKAIFMQNSYWFVSVQWLMDHLAAMEDL